MKKKTETTAISLVNDKLVSFADALEPTGAGWCGEAGGGEMTTEQIEFEKAYRKARDNGALKEFWATRSLSK